MATTPTDSTTTPPSTPVIYGPINFDNLNESWCDIQYKSGCSSTGSISHLNHTVNPEILEKLLQEAQREVLSPSPPLAPIPTTHHLVGQFIPAANSLASSSAASVVLTPEPTATITHNATLSPFHCSQCIVYRQQIDILLEKQSEHVRQIGALRRRFSVEVESRTPDLSVSTPSPPASPTASYSSKWTTQTVFKENTKEPAMSESAMSVTDWSKLWASRPQKQPPKDWNFVHPNSVRAKLLNAQNDEDPQDNRVEEEKFTSKLFANQRYIGKLIFTHMASLIVGATLMYLVFRRHLNAPSESVIYF